MRFTIIIVTIITEIIVTEGRIFALQLVNTVILKITGDHFIYILVRIKVAVISIL